MNVNGFALVRMLGDMEGSGSAVAEFHFDQESGVWRYKMLRHDKTVGNYVSVVNDTFAGQGLRLRYSHGCRCRACRGAVV